MAQGIRTLWLAVSLVLAGGGIAVAQDADLSVAITDSADPVDAGTAFDYTVSVANGGPDQADNLSLEVGLDAAVIFSSASGTGWSCGHAAGTVTCTRPQLDPGNAPNVVVSVTAPGAADTLTTTADVTSSTSDPDTGDTSASETTEVEAVADLAVALADSPDPVLAADPLTYTVSVDNNGPDPAPAVQAALTLDPDLSYQSASGTGWSCSEAGGVVTCSRATDLAVGAAPDITVTATAPDNATTLSSGVTASSDGRDETPGNDSDSEATSVRAQADLETVTTFSAGSAVPGQDRISATITVTNNGPSDLTGVLVSAAMPPGLVSAIWSCQVSPGTGACRQPGGAGDVDALVNLDSGASASFGVAAWVDPDADGTPSLDATATVPAGTTESAPGNNDDSDTISLAPATALDVTKTNQLDALSQGQAFEYTITVQNEGPSTDGTALVTDTFQAELLGDVVACSPSTQPCWTCAPAPPLQLVDRAVENSDGVTGLEGVRAGAVSPDGAHVYLASGSDDAVVVLARGTSPLGELSFIEAQAGLTGAAGVAIAPDGDHVYATAASADQLVAFSRDSGTGALTQIDVEQDGAPGVDGLDGATGVAVSPDGGHVYVASPDDAAISVFDRAGDGTLTFAASFSHAELTGVRDVVVSGDGRHLYAVSFDVDAVVRFDRDRDATSAGYGELSGRTALTLSGFSQPYALAISPDGGHLYVSGRESVVVLTRGPSGSLGEQQRVTSGTDGARDVAVSVDGDWVLVAATGLDAISVYQRSPVNGELTLLGSVDDAAIDGLAGGNAVLVTPDGRQALATGAFGGSGFTNATVSMALVPGASCGAGGSGDLSDSAEIPAGGFVTYSASVRVTEGFTGTVCNTASASGLSSDSDQDCDDVVLATDLEVTADDGVTSAVPGTQHGYSITVANRGTLNVAGATVTNSFPVYDGSTVLAGFESGSVTWECVAEGGACCTSGTGDCGTPTDPVTGSGAISDRAVDLPPGASVTFATTGTIHPSASGTLVNPASVAPPAGVQDSNLANNTSEDDDTALSPEADVVILKEHGAVSGGTVPYTITVENQGPSTAAGATVQDTFPAGLDNVSWTCSASSGASCASGSMAGNISDTVTIPPDGLLTYSITADIVGPAPEPVVVNTASVTGGSAVDPVPSNNTSTDQLTLEATANLAITKTDGRVEAIPGEDLTYVVTVTNAGPDSVIGAQVTDLFPPDLVNASWTCDATPPVPGDIAAIELFSFAGARAVVLSADGEHVYAAANQGSGDGLLTAYAREADPGPLFGKLGVLQTLDTDDIPELAGVVDVIVSEDGLHGYAASPVSDSILVFVRDRNPAAATFGELTAQPSATVTDGVSGVDGLDGVVALALTPDGAHLYAASADDGAIAVFERDAGTGALSFVEHHVDGGASAVLAGASDVVLSPDGDHVYVAGSDDDGIAVFSRDGASGALTWLEDVVEGSGGVTGLDGPESLVVSPGGHQLYAAGGNSGAVVHFSRDAVTGSLSHQLTYPGTTAVPPASEDSLAGVSSLHLTGDGQHLIAAASGADSLVVFRRNTSTGLLTYQEQLKDGVASVDGLQGVSAVASSPDGAHLYTAAPVDGDLGVFSRRQPDPAFAFVEAEIDGVDGPDDAGGVVDGLFGARDLVVTPDGQHVIAVGFGDDAVAVFSRDAGAGTTPDSRPLHLSFLQSLRDGASSGGGTVSGLSGAAAVVATNTTVYVAGENANAVAVFSRNPTTGVLTFEEAHVDGAGGVDGLAGASSVALSPGENHLYASGLFDAAVAIFDVSPATGLLTYRGLVRNGVGQVEGLDGVSDLVVSGDGKHLYAVSRTDDAIVVFDRASDGDLGFSQAIYDGQGGSDGLDRALSVAISPDGSHLYVAAANDDSVATFSRVTDETSPAFGRLVFQSLARDGTAGVDGLGGARAVAVSSDGKGVYAVGEFDDALVAFARVDNDTSPAFGALSLVEVRVDGVDGVDGVGQPHGVAASGDGRHVYVAAFGDHAVSAFVRRAGSRCSASGAGAIQDTVDIGFGGSVTYTVRATVRPGATGTLTNTAAVAVPVGVTDPVPADNVAVDVNTLTPESDLAVSKTDAVTSAVPGESLEYRIEIGNNGPSNAMGAEVTDLFSADFGAISWTCLAVGSGSLTTLDVMANGTGGVTDLSGPSGVAAVPDPDGAGPLAGGQHVYVSSFDDNSVVWFERDDSTGLLSFAGSVVDGVGGVDGLGGASSLAMSRDGLWLFATGQLDDSLAVFERNPISGSLTYRMHLTDGSGGVDGLDQPSAVVVSEDATVVLVAGSNDDAVALFEHAAGTLSFAGLVRDGIAGVDGLDGVAGLALSPGGDHLYAAGFNDGAVAVFELSGSVLSFVERKTASSTAGLEGASAVVVSGDGGHVYVAGASDDALVVFSRNSGNGRLTPVEVESDPGTYGLGGVRSLALSEDGEHLYAGGQAVDSVALFRRDAGTGELEFAERIRGSEATEGLNGVSSLALSPDGNQVYATGFVDDTVVVLGRSADSSCAASGTGDLTSLVDVAAGGRVVFTITAEVLAGATGEPCPAPDQSRQCVVNTAVVAGPVGALPDPVSGNNTATDADFVSLRADLAITKDDGLAEYDGLLGAHDLAVDPVSGDWLYVAGPDDNAIGVFVRDTSGGVGFGTLDFLAVLRDGVSGVDGLGGVAGLAATGDGLNLYAAGSTDNAVSVFRRAPGGLEFVETELNGVGGVSGLLGASAVAVSPDGHHVYVAGTGGNSLAVFKRSGSGAGDGELDFLEALVDGTGGVSGLTRPSAVAVSPDGGHVYVTGDLDGTIVVLARESDSGSAQFGRLSYVEHFTDGAGGIEGLAGASAVAVDDHSVYVAGATDDALVVFSRQSDSDAPDYGQLDLLEVVSGVASLAGVRGLELSPAPAEHLYASGGDADAVAVFSRVLTPGAADYGALHLEYEVWNGDDQGGPVVQDLDGPRAVAVSPDGEHTYVAAAGAEAVVAFDRDASPASGGFGDLVYLQSVRDGAGGAPPGSDVTYVISVTNTGPGDVSGARVRDLFPTEFQDVAWVCSTQGAGASCDTLSGVGDLDELVDLPVGTSVVYEATGLLRGGVTGSLSNTATVAAPSGVIDPDLSNNSATDDDTILAPVADLWVTKANGLSEVAAGQQVTYQVAVANDGPSHASDVRVVDELPEALHSASWSCVAEPAPGLVAFLEGREDGVGGVDGLDGISSVAVSGDGLRVFAVGGNDDAVAVFQRDQRNGSLAWLGLVEDGVGGVAGLDGASSVAVSGDDRHLYVTGAVDDAVSVFQRDGSAVGLALVETERDGIGGVNGLGGARDVVVSPSGDTVYVAGTADNAIAVFERSPGSGDLSFLDDVIDGAGGVDGLGGVSAMVLSPDGSHLYASGTAEDAVAVFERQPDGALVFVGVVRDGVGGVPAGALLGAAGLAVSQDGGHLYVAAFAGDAVSVFERDSSSGGLTFVQVATDGVDGFDGLGGSRDLVLSGDQQQLYVAAATDGAITALRIDEDGHLAPLESFDGSTPGFASLTGLSALAASGDDLHLYGAVTDENRLAVLGRLPGSECPAAGVGGIDALVDLAPGGTATFQLTGTVVSVVAPDGSSVVNQVAATAPAGVVDPDLGNNTATDADPLVQIADLAVVKDDGVSEVSAGTEVTYEISVTNLGPSDVTGVRVVDAVPVFPADPGGLVDGSLSWTCASGALLAVVDAEIDGVDGVDGLAAASWVAVHPDVDGPGGQPGGQFVYVTGAGDHAVSVFERDLTAGPDYGDLSLVQTVVDGEVLPGGIADGLNGAAGVAVTPDGRHLIVAGGGESALTVFEVDPDAGTLDLVEVFRQGVGPVDGLIGAAGVAVSGDGLNVYVAGLDADAVVVFLRDPETGQLSYVERQKDGLAGLPLVALDGARDVVVSPDGGHVYVAAQVADAITVFERNQQTGELEFVQVVRNLDLQQGVTVNGLDFVRAVAISPGGDHLYAASLGDDAVVVFERDPSSGFVTFVEVHRDGQNGVAGIDGATDLSLSPDGSSVMAVGTNSDAVAVFGRDWTTGRLTFTGSSTGSPPGLDGASGLALAPDGSQVCVVAANGDALVALTRQPAGTCAAGSGTGALDEIVDLSAGATVTFSMSGTVDGSARGILENTAAVTPPASATDPDASNDSSTDTNTIVVVSDVGITKSNASDSVVAGLGVVYTITVANQGPGDALGVAVEDVLPDDLLQAEWTCEATPGSNCSSALTSGDVADTADILAGGSVTYTVTGTLDPAAQGTLENTATLVLSEGSDPTPGDHAATDSDAVVALTNLTISKDNGVDEVVPGTSTTYTIVVANAGPSHLASGTVVDSVPGILGGAAWTCSASVGSACTAAGSGSISDSVVIAAGGTVTYQVGGTVDPSATGSIANTASVQAGGGASDPDLTDNVAGDVDPLIPEADLGIDKTDDVDPAVTGSALVYTITVSNAGPSTATGVTVGEVLPAGVTLTSTAGCGEDPGGVPSCTLGTILPGDQAVATIEVTIDEGTLGTIVNAASVASAVTDPAVGDNATTESTDVEPWADLSISKSDDADPATAGTQLVYTLMVTNPGPYDAEGVEVTDTLPLGLTGASTSGCAEDGSGGGFPLCTLGTVAAGGVKSYTLTADVDPSVLGPVVNTAEVASVWFDPNVADNTTTEETEIVAVADLWATKTNGVNWSEPGDAVTYVLTIGNDGPSDAVDAGVDDQMPVELVSVTWTCAPGGGAFCSPGGSGNTLLDTVDIPSGSSVVYTVDATVDPLLVGEFTVVNTVEVAAGPDTTDPVADNNAATDADNVGLVFADGFESGDVLEWSGSVPALSRDSGDDPAAVQGRIERDVHGEAR